MSHSVLRRMPVLVALAAASAACADAPPTAPGAADRSLSVTHPVGRPLAVWLRRQLTPRGRPGSAPAALLAGAGDIARCYPGADVTAFEPPGPDHPAERTARLLDAMPQATVMAVGDNAYEFGSPADYLGCYHPTWGRHRERTKPATGNHEYLTPGAAGYFAYFLGQTAPPGYYSYDRGSWHIVVLNSTPQVYACWPQEANEVPPGFPSRPPPPVPDPAAGDACVGDVVQQGWLAADLASNADARCTLAYFHHPRFSSGPHGSHYQMQRIWRILYAYGVDVVVSGHDHLYERFAPQDPLGERDERWGIRQFTVGTGGAEPYDAESREPNSERLILDTHGIIALALDEGRYRWAFVGVDETILDAGSEACHDPPSSPPTLPFPL